MATKTSKTIRTAKGNKNGYRLVDFSVMTRKVGKALSFFIFGFGPYRNSKDGNNLMHGRLSPKLESEAEARKWLRGQLASSAIHKGDILPGHHCGEGKCTNCTYVAMHGMTGISFTAARGDAKKVSKPVKKTNSVAEDLLPNVRLPQE